MIEADIVAKLKATTAITAIAGQRIYPAPPPEGAALPLVTWQMISDAPTRVADGVLNYRWTRVQINVWAADRLTAINLSNAVRAALDGWKSTAVHVATTINVVDRTDATYSPPRHGRALDVAIGHRE